MTDQEHALSTAWLPSRKRCVCTEKGTYLQCSYLCVHSEPSFVLSLSEQVYLYGGKLLKSMEWSPSSQSNSIATNSFFEYDTVKQLWRALPDGPPGAVLFDFVFLEVDSKLFLHGGQTSGGVAKATLWQVQIFSSSALNPLWTMLGTDGIGARKQHCAAELNGTIFFWGGKSGMLRIKACSINHGCMQIYVCIYIYKYVCMHSCMNLHVYVRI
jgi:hypothetical protein